MILIIAVLAILLLALSSGMLFLYKGFNTAHRIGEDYKQRWHDELDVSSKLRNEKHHEWERSEIAQERISQLKQEIADIHASFKKDFMNDEFGSSANWYNVKPATSQTYFMTFCVDPNGQKIMNDLEQRFKRNPFTDDERETCRRLGRMEVYDFILNRINNSKNPNYSEQLEIAYMNGQLEQNDD